MDMTNDRNCSDEIPASATESSDVVIYPVSVFGMHGTKSELEHANMRTRSIEDRNRKVARGELFVAVAAGYRRVGRNWIEKDPDLRVRAAIDLVFSKFDELQSIRQVLELESYLVFSLFPFCFNGMPHVPLVAS